jgi:hypothetical protein
MDGINVRLDIVEEKISGCKDKANTNINSK